MNTYASLITGLKHVSPAKDLNPGCLFIVRYKNRARNYNTDLWIAVLLPDDFQAAFGLQRPPKGAKPASGEWTTDPDKRVYPAYLPGVNLYRWVHVTDLFVLTNKPPHIFVQTPSRYHKKELKVYRDLLAIIDKEPGIEFWKSMAKKESLAKGKRGKNVELVLPDGFEDILEGIPTLGDDDSDNDASDASDASDTSDAENQPDVAELEGEPPRKVLAVTGSFSSSKGLAGPSRQREKSPKSLTFPGEKTPFPSFHVGTSELAGGSQFAQTTSMSTKARTQVSGKGALLKVEEKPVEGVNNALLEQQSSVFEQTWTLAAMIEHILLGKENSQGLLAVFRDISTVQEPESGKLISFLKTQEFTPHLLRTSLARQGNSGEGEEFEIGDCLGIHRQFQLHGVTNSTDLHEQIAQLGRLYSYARRLNMVDLVEKITFKLQAAWNSYPGLSQLESLLDVTAMAFKDSTCTDHFQDWLVKFIADTLDLIFYQCPHRYWALMRGQPDLYNSVTRMRSELNRKIPERHANPRDQIRQRGIDDF
ncbi:uncharacterized protein N7496_001473 [Penicillium cataractarum]|uniref:Uncharacterized protein n=1 Tax=Penicillium cataractarum TaxID=2100454 RepID=A0A9W9VWA4_9EURO|nr:uncharacterized protein N7496_001473 [Penicillium cataractarum]KAJ5390405.1 hypothetical protein N7496_001473 [Penicillium cataractarum]